MGARPLEERRHRTRPRNGDVKPCPKCGSPECCEFNDHYRFDDVGTAPGWICGCPPCRYRELVRRAHQQLVEQRDRIAHSRAVQARAKRRMMNSRSIAERSQKRLAKSADYLKKPR